MARINCFVICVIQNWVCLSKLYIMNMVSYHLMNMQEKSNRVMEFCSQQFSANYSTPLCYSRKTQYSTYYSGSNITSNRGSIFALGSTQIPIFWMNMANSNRVESNRTEVFVFLTIYGS